MHSLISTSTPKNGDQIYLGVMQAFTKLHTATTLVAPKIKGLCVTHPLQVPISPLEIIELTLCMLRTHTNAQAM